MRRLLKKLALTTVRSYKQIQKPLSSIERKQSRLINVPYYSQWESPDLVDQIIAGELWVIDDPKWKNSGAKTRLDYLNWSWNGCGLACTQMVLEYYLDKKIPLVTLGERSLKYGCYQKDPHAFGRGNYQESLAGLFYYPFVRFMKEEFNLQVKVFSPLIIAEISDQISKNNLVMASVASSLRDPSQKTKSRGTHLVLIVGYDLEKEILLLHNPAGLYKKSQEYAKISFAAFERAFDHKGMAILNPTKN